MTDQSQVIAVSVSELKQFGCAFCGYRSGYTPVSGGGGMIWQCGDCGQTTIAVAEGLVRSPIGVGVGGESVYPEVCRHPRYGIPSHGNADKRPDGGGEFFRSRGIGLDSCTCFVCGTDDRDGEGHCMLNNIAAFVQCKEAGKRVVAMFHQGARLAYRDFEPDRVQVKIGACDKHLPNLKKLNDLTREGVIKSEYITQAMT